MTSILERQGPTLRIGPDRSSMRHATWLELFFDLVFVVAVAELAHGLGFAWARDQVAGGGRTSTVPQENTDD